MWKDDKCHGLGILLRDGKQRDVGKPLDEPSFDIAMYSNGEKVVSSI